MNNRLVGTALLLVVFHALPTVAADSAPTFEAFRGTLGKGKKMTFTMLLRRNGIAVSGVYFYDAIKMDIRLAGNWEADGTLVLTESDGRPTQFALRMVCSWDRCYLSEQIFSITPISIQVTESGQGFSPETWGTVGP